MARLELRRPGQPFPEAGRGFRLRTAIIPFAMILIHLLVIDIVANLYAQRYAWLSPWLNWPSLAPGQAYANTQDLILNEYPRIAVFYGLVLIPLYSLILYFRHLNWSDAIWLKRPRGRDLWPALVLAVGLLGVTNLLFSGLLALGDRIPAIQRQMADYIAQAEAFSPALGYGWLIAGISILAPLSEELLFRGIIQGELRRAMPEWLAVVLQAVLFALFHVQPVQVLYVLLPALALGAMYAVTRSIWVPVLMHILFNFLGSVVPAMTLGHDRLSQLVVWIELGFAGLGIGVVAYLWQSHRRS